MVLKKGSCVAVDTLTSVHCFPAADSECPLISSNVSFERTHHHCSEFFFKKEPDIQNLLTRKYFVDIEGTETPGDVLLKLLKHYLYNFFFR
jgi:hypothetical protein